MKIHRKAKKSKDEFDYGSSIGDLWRNLLSSEQDRAKISFNSLIDTMERKDWYEQAREAINNSSLIVTAEGSQDYGWVCLDVPEGLAKKIKKWQKDNINEEDLYIEESEEGEDIHGKGWSYGLEDHIHTTVKWGLVTKDSEEVTAVLEDMSGGNVKLGKLGMFENDDYDVLKIDVTSAALDKLNKALSDNLENDDSHPKYQPYVTLAYLKPGKGKEYVDKAIEDMEFDFDKVFFEDSDDKQTYIGLV